MSDEKQALHAKVREAVDDLARAYADAMVEDQGLDADAWFDGIRRQVTAKAETLLRVTALGPMGGGGDNEA